METLTKKQEQAAHLLSEDKLTDEEIAKNVGIGRSTLHRWKLQENFAARVAAITKAYADRVLKKGIARAEVRVEILQDMDRRLQVVMDERSSDPELQNIAGGKTGLVTKMLKGIGKGEDFQVVEVYEVDNATLKERRAILEQVRDEVGQKVAKHEHSGPGGKPLESAFDKLVQLLAG